MSVIPHEVDLGHPATPEDLLRLAREAALKVDRDELPGAVTEPLQHSPTAAGAASETEADLPPIEPPARPLFDRTRLYAPIPDRFAWYEMPGGGFVCIHPSSSSEALWAQRHVVREMRRFFTREGTVKEGLEAEFLAEAQDRGAVWTALVVCRTGEKITDPKCFTEDDAKAFYANPGWSVAAQDIYKHALALGNGESEASALTKALSLFFDKTAGWLLTFVAPSVTDERISSALSDFATCASSKKPLSERLAEMGRIMERDR
jgi:hypothetical protein